MTDYASAPVQPIVQGLVTTVSQEVGPTLLTFFGKGIIRSGPLGSVGVPGAPVALGVGDYLLSLDAGLPGDVAIDPPFGRVLLTVRSVVGVPSPVISKSITYLVSPTPGVGCNQVRIEFANAVLGAVDSTFEIVIWRAEAGVELTNVNIIGGTPNVVFP